MVKQETGSRGRVMFLSEACVLDPNSGAAIEMWAWLQVLQAHGYSCSSVSMSLFDGIEEFPLKRELFPELDTVATVGQRIRTVAAGVEHNIFNTGTTVGPKVSVDLVNRFVKAAAEDIERIKPDVVIGYGTPNLVPLRELAQRQGAKTAFYLCNPSYDQSRKASFGAVDSFVVPSHTLGEYYKSVHGIDGWHVVRNRVRRFFAPQSLNHDMFLARKKHGFVTMVNPSMAKGATVTLQIANQAKARLPNLTFLMVESRAGQAEVEGYVSNANLLENLWWVQRQRDMKQVYRRTALLLVPSLWFEAAGRVIAEAQLSGIPVLATDSGGIPEQLNGGGFLFPKPNLGANYRGIPDAGEVAAWVDRIVALISGPDQEYLTECRRAISSSSWFEPQAVDQSILRFIESLRTSQN